MHIHAIEIKDFKGIKDFKAYGLNTGLVVLTGKNGSGKSSVLDAIEAGLRGGNSIGEKPVREGAEKAEIGFDLGEYIVTRTIDGKRKQTLKVRPKGDKKAIKKGQDILNGLFNAQTIDPTKFEALKPNDQAAELQKALGVDFSDLDAQEKADREKRLLVGKDRDRASNAAKAINCEGAPDELIDVKALYEERDAIREKQDEVVRAKELREEAEAKAERIDEQGASLERQIKELQDHLEGVRKKHEEQVKEVAGLIDAEDAAAKAAEGLDPAPILEKIENADNLNDLYRQKQRKDELTEEAEKAIKEYDALNDKIKGYPAQRAERLAKAKCPVEGLEITDDGITVKGIPFHEMSQAERLRLGFEVGRLINPEIKVIGCREGSNIDDEGIAALREMALGNEFQLWIEMVRTDEDGALIISEGELAK